MSIYEAIFNRYSVREYRMEKIEPERLEALKRYLKTVALLDEEKPVEFEIVDNTNGKQKVFFSLYVVCFRREQTGYFREIR